MLQLSERYLLTDDDSKVRRAVDTGCLSLDAHNPLGKVPYETPCQVATLRETEEKTL